jgi:hypothetical protein
MMGYCSLSKFDFHSLQSPDTTLDWHNSFLIQFLETEEDQFNMVSIRLSITEFIEEIGIADDSYSERLGIQSGPEDNLLLQTLSNLYSGSFITLCKPERVEIMLG